MTLDLVSAAQAAQLLGVTRQRWQQLKDKPQPVIAKPALWERSAVVAYIEAYIAAGRRQAK